MTYKQGWSLLLIVTSFTYWFFPGFNGIFFDNAMITEGEGRIMSSTLLVGGLILWYLPVRKDKN